MRILHVVHQYPPKYVGGTELYTQAVARYQRQQLGHEVTVFFPSVLPGDEELVRRVDDREVAIYAVPLGPRSRRDVFLSLWRQTAANDAFARVLERTRPDIVHLQHLMGLPASLVQQVRVAGIPLVITLHDYWFPCANGQLVTNYDGTVCAGPALWVNCGRCALARGGFGDRPLLSPLVAPLLAHRSYLLRKVLAAADAVIAPNQFVYNTYRELGMPLGNAAIIPHGIEVPQHVLHAPPRPPRSAGEPLNIFYIGSVAQQKGVHVLIDAMNGLPAEQVRLTLYGDLDKFPEYVATLRERASHPGITFAGRIERDELWSVLLTKADVAVLPTLWYEVSPLTIQELFAARVPVVASRIGALPAMIRHEVDGLLFPPGDADALRATLTRLLAEPALLPRLRASIEPTRLTSEHVADLMTLYERVLEAR
jgi:glycosyltransferase involved in cell wall biosynthesis